MRIRLFVPFFLLVMAGSALVANAQALYVASQDIADSFDLFRSEQDTIAILQSTNEAIQKLERIVGKWEDEGTAYFEGNSSPVKAESECSWALGNTSVICVKRQNGGVYYFDQYLYSSKEEKHSVCRHTIIGTDICTELSIEGDKWIVGGVGHDGGEMEVKYMVREFEGENSYKVKYYFGREGNPPTLRFDYRGKRVD